MIKRNLKYDSVFTAMGVLFPETLRLINLLTSNNVLEGLLNEIKENKVLQINSESSRARVIREIRKRNKFAEEGFWNQFASSPENEQRLLLFYLCLKTYRILFDLHFKVTVKRYQIDNTMPETFYYKMALDELASENEKVASWAPTTLKKTLSNYRSLLRVSELLKGDLLTKPNVDDSFWDQFKNTSENWFSEACFQSIK